MALEALGAVASIIAITEAVGKLGKQAIALKKLCDQVKEIPQTLQDHIDEMDRLVSVLDQMGDDLATASKFAIESRAAQQCLLYCRQAASNLEDLIMKLHAQVNAVDKKHSMGQTIIKFKVRLKKNLVDDLERKLEKSLRLLGLADSSLQRYIFIIIYACKFPLTASRAMLMKMMVEVTVMAETRRTVKVEVRDTEPPGILTTAQEGPLELPSTGKAVTRQSYKQPTRPCFDYQELSWSRPGYLPRLCYYAVDEIATTVDNASSSCQKDKNKGWYIKTLYSDNC